MEVWSVDVWVVIPFTWLEFNGPWSLYAPPKGTAVLPNKTWQTEGSLGVEWRIHGALCLWNLVRSVFSSRRMIGAVTKSPWAPLKKWLKPKTRLFVDEKGHSAHCYVDARRWIQVKRRRLVRCELPVKARFTSQVDNRKAVTVLAWF